VEFGGSGMRLAKYAKHLIFLVTRRGSIRETNCGYFHYSKANTRPVVRFIYPLGPSRGLIFIRVNNCLLPVNQTMAMLKILHNAD